MIAICCATTDERLFRAHASATIQALDEGDSLLLRRHGHSSIDEPWNDMLATATARDDIEAVAIVHEAALRDGRADTLRRVRHLLGTGPDVAIVGASSDDAPREAAETTAVFMALSPWAARRLRFDPAFGGDGDSCAIDLALQARAQGGRVLTAPLGISRAWHAEEPADRRRRLLARASLGRKWEAATTS